MNTHLKQQVLTAIHAQENGLNDNEVRKKRERFGFNEIEEHREPLWRLFLRQFQDVLVYILLGAVAISLGVLFIQNGVEAEDKLINAVVIIAIVILNAVIGFFQEKRAEKAIAMLKKLSAPQVKVRRNGMVLIISSRELVPGDVILVEAGDRISADARIFESSSLEVDESSLTGESMPVAKERVQTAKDIALGTIYAGTLVSRGSAEAVVAAIGLNTEIGKISAMVMELKAPPTPLQVQLKNVGKKIGVLVLLLCIGIFFLGLWRGLRPIDVFFTAISLAVAAAPEGLPAIVTICLALGVQRMIKKNALIRKLDAVETLGNINVICADKTGTITENRMKVERTWIVKDVKDKQLAQIAASCNRAILPNIGDPTELGLLNYAEELRVERLEIVEEELPFTSEKKYMVTRHSDNGKAVRYAKGAPEAIAELLSGEEKNLVLKENEGMTKDGLRVLAMASDTGDGFKLTGLVGMLDPPRAGVEDAIRLAKEAGIRTIMITGDNPVTAQFIAKKVGIDSGKVIDGKMLDAMDQEELRHHLKTVSVFARVLPIHKVKILEALQAQGDVVAMTGDGVNDAPALKRAHIGIAMGLKGTDVSRESAAMVLTDDNYITIVAAIAEGRRIYDNIRKFILFLLRTNIGEVLIISSSMLLNLPLPLLPVQILWINLVTDSFPALALSTEPGEPNSMQRPPRKQNEGIISQEIPLLLVAGLLNTIISLWIFYMVLNDTQHVEMARTAVLTATIIFQLFMAISVRSRLPVFQVSPFSNLWLLAAVGFSAVLHVILLATPLGSLFNVTPLPGYIWQNLLIACVVGFVVFELCKVLRNILAK